MWSAFGADVSLLVGCSELMLRRTPVYGGRWQTAGEQRTLLDADNLAPAEPLDVRRGDRLAVYFGDRLCDLYDLPLADGVRDDELLQFAVAACVKQEPLFDAAQVLCVADRVGSGKSCVLAVLPRRAFDAFGSVARGAGAKLVSMQPWCSAVVAHWLSLKATTDAPSRWLMLLEPEVCTVAASAGGVLQGVARLPVQAGQDAAGVLRSAAIACDVDTQQTDVWVRGEALTEVQGEPLRPRPDRAFLHVIKKVAGVP